MLRKLAVHAQANTFLRDMRAQFATFTARISQTETLECIVRRAAKYIKPARPHTGLVATFALVEQGKFLRSVLRSIEILLQNDAMLRQAVRTPNGRITQRQQRYAKQ